MNLDRQLILRNLPLCHACPARQQDGAGSCACTLDGHDIVDHATADYCPLPTPRYGTGLRPEGFEQAASERAAAVAERVRQAEERSTPARGRRAWLKLHQEGPGRDAAWLEEWEKLIPCGDCRRKYDELKAAKPPAFPLAFEWTWWLHDQVNAELQKAERPTLEEARAIHAEGADRRGVEPASIDN